MIEIEHLHKSFGSTRAVQDVSFTVKRGEIIGLLGPNGSGKTTIMRILTGFFPPNAGAARVAGFDAADQSLALRRKIGYLPENVVLYPDMRVRGFLAFCADVRRINGTRKRRRIEAVMHDCGLREVADRLMGTLSKGYRQRTGLAQALLHEPEVLILDEPTVGLDPRQIIEIRSLIRGLRGRTTVLLSTHILPEVSMTCERVVIIDRGRIVAEDSAAALSRRVEGDDRTLVRVDGPAAEVRRGLDAVPGVERIEAADGIGDVDATAGTCSFIVHSNAGEPVRKAIAAAVVGHGWGLIEVRPLALSLEDLFVRLVTTEAVGPLP
ncbi:MAG TPA: ABC transporter ATP-binding protein [Candidatus Acidoferrales bacterium]|nr:ABC transporter ATP-binding protein [Candidatus Acidoferrales bacterium]